MKINSIITTVILPSLMLSNTYSNTMSPIFINISSNNMQKFPIAFVNINSITGTRGDGISPQNISYQPNKCIEADKLGQLYASIYNDDKTLNIDKLELCRNKSSILGKKIYAAIEKIAKNKQLVAIFNYDFSNNNFNIDAEYDITNEVIELLNKEHLAEDK